MPIEYKATAQDEKRLRSMLKGELRDLDERLDTWSHWLRTKQFWCGLAFGVVIMCLMDLTDLHICIGECDGAGYDLPGFK